MALENKYGKSAVDATRRNALPPYLDELFAGGIGGAGVETHDITLTTGGWSNLQQSVVLTCGATDSSDVVCAANNTSMDSDYYMSAFGVSLTNVTVVEGEEEGQNTVTFTFTAVTAPTVNIDVVVIIVNADGSGGVPVATTSRVGVVKPDGTTISVDSNGTIHSIGGGGGGDSASVLYFYNRTVSVASNTEILRITNSGIDTNTVVLECTFADPSVISGTVTWTSYEGYISFVGTCTASTTANVTLSGITEGDLQYMPKSGGNFMGNVSVLGSNVVTESILNPSYSTITVQNATGTIKLLKFGKLRVIYGNVKVTNTGIKIIVGTLVSSDRPPIDIESSATGYSVSAQCEVQVTASGNILVNVPSGANNNSIKFNVVYAVS